MLKPGAVAVAIAAALGSLPSGAAPETASFGRDVAPILLKACVSCHRPDGAAPFSLLTYADARRHATQIAAATRSRFMPPWKPEPGEPAFVGERRLTDDQIRTIDEWARAGAPEGTPRDAPLPARSDVWQLGTPDLVVDLPEYLLRADGLDEFRNFVVPVPIAARQYVRGLEFRPGSRAVHHANIRIDRTSASRELAAADLYRRSAEGAKADPAPGYEGTILRSADYPDGHFLGWTPGQVTPLAPRGLSWALDAGTDLVVQLHLRPTGKQERLRPSIAFYFTADPPSRVPTMMRLGRQNLEIPAGAAAFHVTDAYTVPVDVEVHAIQPHAHYRARSVRVTATPPGAAPTPLIRIERWDFNWQDQYRYRAPFWLPAGTRIEMEYVFDNSADNPRNPDRPPQPVSWGWRSSDEMADAWIQVIARSEGDRARLDADVRRKMAAEDAIGCEILITREPDYPALRADAAALYMELNRPDRALVHFTAAARLQPRSARARYNVGVALEALGRASDAAEAYREAVRLDPSYSLAHNNLGSLLFSAGTLDEARRHFERAVQTGPSNAEAQNNLGAVFLASNDPGGALPYVERAVALRPQYAEAHFNLARIYAATGRPAEARREAAIAEQQASALGKRALVEQVHALRAQIGR
jgi:tetratricopeptide (TPR) repeat protein/mono/diheme cytochrome c family protein